MQLMPMMPALLCAVLCPLFSLGQGDYMYKKPERDTAQYAILRNQPGSFSTYGVFINPLMIEGGPASFPFSIGAGASWQHKTRYGVTLAFQQAYFELEGGKAENGLGIAMKNTSRIQADAQLSLHTWKAGGKYQLKWKAAGRKTQVYSYIPGVKTKTIAGRIGFAHDNRHIGASDKKELNFLTSTPAYQYDTQPLAATRLRQAHTMMRSDIISAGISYNVFADIDLGADKRKTSHTEYYADFLFAAALSLQDVTYRHTVNETVIYQRLNLGATPLSRTGFRLGVRETARPFRRLMSITTLEAGLRPGISGDISSNIFYRAAYGLMLGRTKR